MTQAAILVVFPLCMAYAAFSDLFTMTIPNRVSLILIAAFLGLALLTGMAPGIIAFHLLAATAVFAGCFALFALGVMGGGDAKLLTASALWFGWNLELVSFLIVIGIFGGVLTLAILMARTGPAQYMLSRVPMTHNLTDAKAGIPYGIAIGAAGLVCYPSTSLMVQALAGL
jgi:prepilin peptidase CpaA